MRRKRWPLSLGELYFVAAGPVCIAVATYAFFKGLVRGITNEIVLVLAVSWVAWLFIAWVLGRPKPDEPPYLDHES